MYGVCWSVLAMITGAYLDSIHAYVRRYVDTYIHTYIHTYIWVLVTELENCKDVLLARKNLISYKIIRSEKP